MLLYKRSGQHSPKGLAAEPRILVMFLAPFGMSVLLALWAKSKMWYYLDMISKIIFAVLVISILGISSILHFTTPSMAGPWGVLGLFILAYVFTVCIVTIFLYGTNRVLYFILLNFSRNEKIKFAKRDILFHLKYALALALMPIILVAQQSVSGVGVFEIILVIILEIIAYIYISKR
ncbi:MAG: hypothetical protein Q4A27_02375 [bacterium]|nr:hypothetical protein [bacterium]